MNSATAGHLGTATNPINQDRKWTAKKSYPLSMPLIGSSHPHRGCILARLSPAWLLVYKRSFSAAYRPCCLHPGSYCQRICRRVRKLATAFNNPRTAFLRFTIPPKWLTETGVLFQDSRTAMVVSATDSACMPLHTALPRNHLFN